MILAWSSAVDSKPGPGAYSPSVAAIASRKAAYSIQGRPHGSQQGTRSPGPGQYGNASGKQHVGTAPNPPCYTFGLKALGDREAERKPGPAGGCPAYLVLLSAACML